jgi:GAF domain-containing protein
MALLQRSVEELLFSTGGSRVTIRLDTPGESFPVAAEAVTHGARHIKGDTVLGDLRRFEIVQHLEREREIIVQNDLREAVPPVPDELIALYGAHAQMLAPVTRGEHLAGIISVHDVRGPQQWSERQIGALQQARDELSEMLEAEGPRHLKATEGDLRDAAIQAVLHSLREALSVHRCTLRQDVLKAYAFPVTHESRSQGVNPLLGDFTIVQTGQPVVDKLLTGRSQIVQDDTRNFSADPLFQTMLEHYGDMRSQIVTPLFSNSSLLAILSVHQLHTERTWSDEETELARSALVIAGRLLELQPSPSG